MADNFLGTPEQWTWIGRFAIFGFAVAVFSVIGGVLWVIYWAWNHLVIV